MVGMNEEARILSSSLASVFASMHGVLVPYEPGGLYKRFYGE